MGLDLRAEGAPVGVRWSYSGFAAFRRRLAEHEGFDLLDMLGFRGDTSWGTVTSPLKPLLDHSDCDDVLMPQECAEVAPRLREIVSGWEADDDDRYRGLQLVALMEYCVEAGVDLEFS